MLFPEPEAAAISRPRSAVSPSDDAAWEMTATRMAITPITTNKLNEG